MIAALYVESGGVYFDLPDVDPWDKDRDARLYAGPHPVVAHPPCERWGRYWSGGPNLAAPRRQKGDDGGCFAATVAAVRAWGGVLEHPEASHAWDAFGIVRPSFRGGWVAAGDGIGWTCCVEQGWYGHRSRKRTWLYAAHIDQLPELIWGAADVGHPFARLDDGFHSTAERRRHQRRGTLSRLSKKQCRVTPIPFRDVLLSIARGARLQERGA